MIAISELKFPKDYDLIGNLRKASEEGAKKIEDGIPGKKTREEQKGIDNTRNMYGQSKKK